MTNNLLYNTSNNLTWGPSPASSYTSSYPMLHVMGKAEFDGDVTIQGHNILHIMQKVEDRLAILQEPNPEKLEKFQALKKAYDHYKLMEKLLENS